MSESREDAFFRYFIVASVLAMVLILLPVVYLIFLGLWTLGLFNALKIGASVLAFGWLVKKIGSSSTVKRWMDGM